jgi:hypothetical protein
MTRGRTSRSQCSWHECAPSAQPLLQSAQLKRNITSGLDVHVTALLLPQFVGAELSGFSQVPAISTKNALER